MIAQYEQAADAYRQARRAVERGVIRHVICQTVADDDDYITSESVFWVVSEDRRLDLMQELESDPHTLNLGIEATFGYDPDEEV